MAGVVVRFGEETTARRVIRDDVLDSLYGADSSRPRVLIEEAIGMCRRIVEAGGEDGLSLLETPILGLHPGPHRQTEVIGIGDAIRQAVLLYSSLAQTDIADDEDDGTVQPEEVNRRFATEVRDAVLQKAPALARFFNRAASLHQGGTLVRFGFLSDRAGMHFSTVSAVRQSASVGYARAKLWELARAKEFANLRIAALVTAVPRADDPTLGPKQRSKLATNLREIEREADDGAICFLPVDSIQLAVERVLELSA
ncbi:MAG: hypothetical protein ACOZJX_19120 [Pseudomonadota bacterium]